jgi:hypothetical protein
MFEHAAKLNWEGIISSERMPLIALSAMKAG